MFNKLYIWSFFMVVLCFCCGCGPSRDFETKGEVNISSRNEKRTSFIFSPDGKYLAYGVQDYNKEDDQITHLMVCNPDGTATREVATIPGHYWGGRIIEFLRNIEFLWLGNDSLVCSWRNSPRYIVVSLDGNCLPDINLPDGYKITSKHLSPNGQQVAFTGRPVSTEDGSKQENLFVVELATGKVRRYSLKKKMIRLWGWSPDSSKLAIRHGGQRSYGRTGNYPLAIVDVESGKVSETGLDGVGASWSPDGRFLTFSTELGRGGSWLYHMPVDGRIAILNISTKKLSHISPPAVNIHDEETGRWELEGSLDPVWSPDGQWIAYRKHMGFRESSGLKMRRSDEIWIMNKEGQEARKIMDGRYFYTWVHDSQFLYILKENEITCLDLNSLKSQTLASWKKAEPPPTSPDDTITVKQPGVIVKMTRIDRAYGEAFAAILSEARREYKETFGLSLSDTLELQAKRNPEGKLRLWTDGESHLFLTITSKEQLAPSPRSGIFNIYGMCHELGHMAMYPKMRNLVGLPQGVGEAWAHYAGSVVVDEVARRLGNSIWPEPYDVAAVEGIARLKQQVEGIDWAQLSPTLRGAKVFYEVDKRYGRKILGRALNLALSGQPSGKELMPLFVESLRDLSGDATAGDWIPQEALVPETKWEVKPRQVDDRFFSDIKTVTDKTGMLLYYGDGTSDGKRSMSGSGHAVLFQRPEGAWLLDGVEAFGSRYGTPKSPEKNFSIYICDEDFNPVHEFSRPYGMFQRGDDKWVKIPIEPLSVPQRFYVCLSFNPTRTRGVYVSYDESVVRSHSRCALPCSHVRDVRGKYD